MKLVVDDASDRVVGLHMVGADAGEIVQGFAVAMRAGATKAMFDGTIGIHPTVGRGVRDDARADAVGAGAPGQPRRAQCWRCPTCRPSSRPPASPIPTARWRRCALIYDSGLQHLRDAMQRFVAGESAAGPRAGLLPLRARPHPHGRRAARRRRTPGLSYGFVAGPGRFETTLTRPDLYAHYYLEQFRLLLENHEVELEVGTSTQPIPIHFSFAENDHIEGTMSAERRALMRDVFDLPDLGAMDDGIANGTYEAKPGEAQPLSLFTAARVDYSLHRLRHYTGTAPEWFQNFVLFTNYQFYIDEFVRLGPRGDGRREQRIHRLRRAGQRGHAAARAGRRPSPMYGELLDGTPGHAAAAPAADAGLPPDARGPQRHHAWSTSASARPTPRPSPTTSRCCARTPG